jgi:hypothetical protein
VNIPLLNMKIDANKALLYNNFGSPRTAVNGAISSARDQAVESQAAPNR